MPVEPEREVYEIIPELSSGDLPVGSGLDNPREFRPLLVKYIVKALQNPDWLLVPKYTAAYYARVQQNLSRPQKLQEDDIWQLQELIQDGQEDELLNLAVRIEQNYLQLPHGMGEQDIVARALEIMGSEYANLTMFRGCDFNFQRGYTGIDFAVGDLPTALSFAHMHTGLSRQIGRSTDQVVAMAKVRDVAWAYAHDKLSIGTEVTWGRGSLEIIIADDWRKMIPLRRPPVTDEARDKVLAEYKKGAIRLDLKS